MNLPGSGKDDLKELVQSSGIPVIALGTNTDEYVLAQASLYRIIGQVHTKNIECKCNIPFLVLSEEALGGRGSKWNDGPIGSTLCLSVFPEHRRVQGSISTCRTTFLTFRTIRVVAESS